MEVVQMVTPIQFRFHLAKTIEAAAVLLKLHNKPMKYLGLLKMLYIADRIALKRIEQPITGDHYVSMDYGPVLSNVYDLIKKVSVDDDLSLWSKFICSNDKYNVSLRNDPGNGELCQEEEQILNKVYEKLGHLNPFDVAQWTHNFPEWQNPHGSAIPILVEDILRHIGKTDEEIEQIRQEANWEAYLDEALHGANNY